jgi:hypothetical protein
MIKAKKMMGEKTLISVISLILLFSGCASMEKLNIDAQPPDEINPRADIFTSGDPKENDALLKEIIKRNKTIEDEQGWIEASYKGLKIKNIQGIPEKDFKNYGKYLDNGAIYIIVHPAFFPFFHTDDRLTEELIGPFSEKNVIEKFLELKSKKPEITVLQAQERRMRDFLELKSSEKKLIILILPKDYNKYSGYAYKNGPDEYTRYLNEATNESESVLYIHSRSATRGYLKEEDLYLLMGFLLNVDASKILIGGGYIGRCLEGFYVDLTEEFGEKDAYIVPELSDVSPKDIRPSLARRLLMPDGKINVKVATEYLKNDVYDVQNKRPNILNISKMN